MLAIGVISASGVAVSKIAEVRNEAIQPTAALVGEILPKNREMSLSELDRAVMWTPESPNRMVIHYGGDVFVSGDYSNPVATPHWKRMSRDTLKLF